MDFDQKILIVDDDKELTDIIVQYFSRYKFNVIVENDGSNLEEIVKTEKPSLILLDIMLPDENGFDILRKIQKEFDIPVIMLTAKGDEVDKIIGLEMGADDYVTKPFSPRELIARIRTVLRRTSTYPVIFSDKKEIEFENFSLLPNKRSLVINGEELELTKTEFEILYLLSSNIDKTFTREELLKLVSDRDYAIFDRSIDMHISHLRNKLKEQNPQTCFIKTVWGSGYRFEIVNAQKSK